MGADDTTDGEAPNRYRESLGNVLPRASGHAETVQGAFAAVRRALAGGAWVGAAADTFAAELADKEGQLQRAAEACETELAARHRYEPARVPLHDRRARFS